MDDEPLLDRAAELGRVFFTRDDNFLVIADRWVRLGGHSQALSTSTSTG